MNQQMVIDPSALELDDIYRGLPKQGSLLVSTNDPERMIRQMEQIGFVAMEIVSIYDENERATIQAFKGKHGPCQFNGWTALYSGKALAALDDDMHLLIRDVPIEVCDKTKTVFSLLPYHGLIKCRNNDKKILEHPIVAENIDFEQGMAMLYEKVNNSHPADNDRIALFYAGPFKALILDDGTFVRRGRTNSVPNIAAVRLMKGEHFFSPRGRHLLPEPVFFHQRYAAEGSMFLNETFKVLPVYGDKPPPDLAQLKTIGKPLNQRLLDTIEKQRKYFVLVGSDTTQPGGCCPSQEVTEANLLSRHGILSAYREPATGDACPVTVYSFRDELTITDVGIESKIDSALRQQVSDHLGSRTTLTWKTIARWVLLVFVVISLLLAAKKCRETRFDTAGDQEVLSLLNPQKTDVVQLILFHNEKRCFQCLEMERLASEVVNESFGHISKNGKLVFTTIAMDNPQFSSLNGRYGLFSTTLVLVRYDSGMITGEKPLMNTGSLYRDENAFKAQLQADLQHFIDTTND